MPNGVLYRGNRKWIFNPRIWFGHARQDPSLVMLSTIVGCACALAVAALFRHSLYNPDVHYRKKLERSANRYPYNQKFKLLNVSDRDYSKLVNYEPKLD